MSPGGLARCLHSLHLEFNIHTPAKGRHDVHQRIERETGDSAAQQVVANELKTCGVAAIEDSLAGGRTEAVVSVRGARRHVVMELAQYQHLRECELEAPPASMIAVRSRRASGGKKLR